MDYGINRVKEDIGKTAVSDSSCIIQYTNIHIDIENDHCLYQESVNACRGSKLNLNFILIGCYRSWVRRRAKLKSIEKPPWRLSERFYYLFYFFNYFFKNFRMICGRFPTKLFIQFNSGFF